MLITPIKPKTVTFQLPANGHAHQRAATAPPATRTTRQQLKQQQYAPPPSPLTTTTSSTHHHSPITIPTGPRSPQPDLIADIIERPKSAQPSAKTKPLVVERGSESPMKSVVSMKEVVPGSGEKVDHKASVVKSKPAERRTTPGHQARVSKAKSIRGHRLLTSTQSSSMRHGSGSISSMPTQVTRMVYQVRDQTNVSSLDHVRWMKHDVAKLREHLVKIEEEVKHANKAKVLLDQKVFDLRKCLSVNQQSVSAQQKKSHREDAVMKKLREETHVLAKSKRRLEQHLVTIKSHNWTLDSMRKTVKSKIAILSKALELDAQNFKLYEGPVATRPESVSKRRHYAHKCPLPPNTAGDEAVAQLCSKVVELITNSKMLRGEMKAMIQAIYINKAEAHDKITAAVSRAMEQTRAHQNELMLQKGKNRMQANGLAAQRKTEEIALGLALGAVSESYKSVAEKNDRPLSRMRPGSAVVEKTAYKNMAEQITRQMSASAGRASRMANCDTSLGKRIKDDGRCNDIDLQMLHKRTASLHRRVNYNNL